MVYNPFFIFGIIRETNISGSGRSRNPRRPGLFQPLHFNSGQGKYIFAHYPQRFSVGQIIQLHNHFKEP